jgi:hypothetical protein
VLQPLTTAAPAPLDAYRTRLSAAFGLGAEQSRVLLARVQTAPDDLLPWLRERLLLVTTQRHAFYRPAMLEHAPHFALWARREVDDVLGLARDAIFGGSGSSVAGSKLVVKLVDGADLRGTDLYVSATLDNEQKQRSPVQHAGAPWNHTFEFDVASPDATLTLHVKAHHRLARNANIGAVRLSLRDLERAYATRRTGTFALARLADADDDDAAAATAAAAAAPQPTHDDEPTGSLHLAIEYRSPLSAFVELAESDTFEAAAAASSSLSSSPPPPPSALASSSLAAMLSTSTRRPGNYMDAFRLLVSNLVDAEGTLLLDEPMSWLLNEFALRFGVQALWRHIVNLEKAAAAPLRFTDANLITAMAADVAATLRLLNKKDAVVTKRERAIFDAFSRRVAPQLDDAVLQHRTLFPRNEPDGALLALLSLHRATATDAASSTERIVKMIESDARLEYQQLRQSTGADSDDSDASNDDGDGDDDAGAGADEDDDESGSTVLTISSLPRGDDAATLSLLRTVRRVEHALSEREHVFGAVFAKVLRKSAAADDGSGRGALRASATPTSDKASSQRLLSGRVAHVMEQLLWDDVCDYCQRSDGAYKAGQLLLHVKLKAFFATLQRRYARDDLQLPRRSLAAPFKPILYGWLRASAENLMSVVRRAVQIDDNKATADDKLYSSSLTDAFAAVNSAVAQLELWQTEEAFHVIQFGDVAAECVAEFARLQMEQLKKACASDAAATPPASPASPASGVVAGAAAAAAGAADDAPPPPPNSGVSPVMCVVLVNLDTARGRYQRLVSHLEEHCLSCVRASAIGDESIMEAFDVAVQRTVDLILALQREARGTLIARVSARLYWLLSRAIERGGSPGAELQTPLFEFLDEHFDMLTANLTGKLFQAMLRGVFNAAVTDLTEICLRLSLTHDQVQRAVRLVRHLGEYFHGDGHGLSTASVAAQTQLIEQVLELYEEPSQQLVDFHVNLDTKRAALDAEMAALERDAAAAPPAAADRDASLLEHREMLAAAEESSKQPKKRRGHRVADDEEKEAAHLPTTRQRSSTATGDAAAAAAATAAAAAAAIAAADAAEKRVEQLTELRRKRAELTACADCVRRILAGRHDDKTAAAFAVNASRAAAPGAGAAELSSHRMARALFGLPENEMVLADFNGTWGMQTGVLYLMSSSLCFHGSNSKFVLPLKTVTRVERPRFSILKLRVVVNNGDAYDLALLRPAVTLHEIVQQAATLGHTISHD